MSELLTSVKLLLICATSSCEEREREDTGERRVAMNYLHTERSDERNDVRKTAMLMTESEHLPIARSHRELGEGVAKRSQLAIR